MLGTLLGLPLSTIVGERFGWRVAFWVISGITVLAALAALAGVPRLGRAESGGSVREENVAFKNPRLWLALSTSTPIIGATFSAFSYFHPILTEVTGFRARTPFRCCSSDTVPRPSSATPWSGGWPTGTRLPSNSSAWR
ncbi:MFS transporter [Streptomyces inhibens]|uniref:MFS transporter n=1 Tax=Streptomyces inhibens TaxID=2293571 RepID=UPI0037B58520